MLIFAHENERAHVISDDFSEQYLWNLVVALVSFTFIFTLLYISTLLSCLLVVMVLMGSQQEQAKMGCVNDRVRTT
jgi:membrane-anchored glycerophosphoryl diester phosphodiesterase (GDPDase)